MITFSSDDKGICSSQHDNRSWIWRLENYLVEIEAMLTIEKPNNENCFNDSSETVIEQASDGLRLEMFVCESNWDDR